MSRKTLKANEFLELGLSLLIQRFSGIGYWRIDLPSEVLHWSSQIYEIHGYNVDRFVPDVDSAIAAYHPEDRPKIRDAIESALQGHEGFSLRARILHRDGHVIWIDNLCEILREEDGTPTAICGVLKIASDVEAEN